MTTDLGTLAVLAPLLLLLIGLGFTVWVDPYIGRERRRVMLLIVLLSLSLVAQNMLEYRFTATQPRRDLRTALTIYGYAVRPVILILFLYIVHEKKKKLWPWWVLTGINAAVYLSALFSPVSFWIDEGNCYHGGPLASSCILCSMILLGALLMEAVRNRRKNGRWSLWIPAFVFCMIVTSVELDYNVKEGQLPISFLTIAITVGSVFYYVWLHLQFVREHERDLMAAQRIQIMMTQIQPHFLFNALNTIRALYAKDPPLADRTLEDFSTYLRQNLESLNQTGLIPMAKELEHTRLYAQIESLRFPHIRVVYRIEDEAFQVPALTIQPLVENAIRHGVRGREDGVVTVSTLREGEMHQILVEDNGVGFDPKATELSEGTHIGLRNVRDRIEQMCGGTMLIRSEIGRGTTVTLLIPDQVRSNKKERGV
jgi:anti-sigma regulatory factor (Ser/Thr protein kinase)